MNPFVGYRSLLHSYQVARGAGMSDEEYCRLVETLDASVAEVDGQGFRVTPFMRADRLSTRLGFSPAGGVWIKDETGNVSGSHKARHLIGVAIYLEVIRLLGLTHEAPYPMLAVASCGNAALAAAIIARALRREVEVFVPVDAPQPVMSRLHGLGARITVCAREPGVLGDPAYLRLRNSVARGALPFTCQGSENGLIVEGGETRGWEKAATESHLDRIIVQVGGGALASSVIQSFREAAELGAISRSPRIDTVQTSSAHPLERAYENVVARIDSGETPQEALRYAATHRSQVMRPLEGTPRSVATGILDDETYDWLAVVAGMVLTGGQPLIVDEPLLLEANSIGRQTTGIDISHTGSSGLAGLIALVRARAVDPQERVAVLFTGAQY
jgi:threonine dehydratase